jgi:hypothetical protein
LAASARSPSSADGAGNRVFLECRFVSHVALVAVVEEGGRPVIVGGGRYDRPIGDLARDHRAGEELEPHAAVHRGLDFEQIEFFVIVITACTKWVRYRPNQAAALRKK